MLFSAHQLVARFPLYRRLPTDPKHRSRSRVASGDTRRDDTNGNSSSSSDDEKEKEEEEVNDRYSNRGGD